MIKFNEDLEAYTLEIDGILFSWEEEPEGDYESEAQIVAENYKNNLSKIIEFISEDIREVYGDMELEEIKENLGKAIRDIYNILARKPRVFRPWDEWRLSEIIYVFLLK